MAIHNLQMCMTEYRCCLKFRRGDNSTYIFTKRGVGFGGVALTRYMDGRTDGWMDGRTDRVIPIYLPNFVCGGYNNTKGNLH
jgi:hypothetical protein